MAVIVNSKPLWNGGDEDRYIYISTDFFDHLKTKKLKKRCGALGIIGLQQLWIWTAKNRPDGRLTSLDLKDIERIAEWNGIENLFSSTLLELHWIDEDDGVLSIHNWMKHQSHLTKPYNAKGRRILDISYSAWNKLRTLVFERDKYTCQYCGATNIPLECDHVFPFSLGGKSTLDNLVTSCRTCNRRKSNKTLNGRGM